MTESRELDKIFIKQLKVTNYRNFSSKKLSFSKNLVAIIGNNGIGKTNLLEALSMLAPGKGLKGQKLEELENFNSSQNGWSVKIDYLANNIEQNFHTAKDSNNRNRQTYVNDNKISKQQDLTKYLNIIWLTPSHDGIFQDDKSTRRRFFDRIVYNLYPEHLQNLMRYDYYLKERLNILIGKDSKYNSSWISNIEKEIAMLANQITSARIQTIKYINAELEDLSKKYPKSFLTLEGDFEAIYLELTNDLEREAKYLTKLEENRNKDKLTSKSNFGIHKSDFQSIFLEKNMPAKLCSTGEQKSLLISTIIAKAKVLSKYNNKTPIILLDEVISHLDKKNSKELIEEIKGLNLQCFFTSTTKENFDFLDEVEIIEMQI